MKKKSIFSVFIQWLSLEEGGKHHIPKEGIYYCTTQINQSLISSSWSLMIEIDIKNSQVARMQFLVPDVPIEIKVGDILPLLEGHRTVAYLCIESEL
jgi:hypothetical protein